MYTLRNSTIQDCLFLSIAFIASTLLYLGGLGFYSDDWAFLGIFKTSEHQSLLGLIQSYDAPDLRMRPIQILYYPFLYYVFGTNPLGYHLTNTGFFVASDILFYLILMRLGLPRIISVAVPLIFILLPNYSTTRFWFAIFTANISLMFYLFSLYSGMRAAAATSRQRVWEWMSIFGLVVSTLSYEVFLPLYLLNIYIFWKIGVYRRRTLLFIACSLLLLIGITIFKALITTRYGNGPFQGVVYYIGYLIYIAKSVLTIHWWTYGFLFPWTILTSIRLYGTLQTIATSLLFGCAVFYYITRIYPKKSGAQDRLFFFKLGCVGIIIFWLGFSIFFINNNIGFSPTGISNRVTIASALGLSFLFISCAGLASSFLSKFYTTCIFCLLITLIATGGFFLNTVLGNFWTKAYQKEKVILADIRQHIPHIPEHSVLFLDGICPYEGPAIVFESNWDLAGALKLLYNDSSIRAAVVSRIVKVNDTGLSVTMYGNEYDYSYKELFVYNYAQKQMYTFPDKTAAETYFAEFNPNFGNTCPAGTEGYGVPVLTAQQ